MIRKNFFKHGDHYKSLSKYLREKPQRGRISRKQMYEAEKKKRNCVSPVAKEEIRKVGRSKKEAIVVDDLPPAIINSSINMLAMERKEEQMEEECAEKSLALLIERAKEEKLRQKTYTHRVGVVHSKLEDKRKEVGNLLDYLIINKNKTFAPNTLLYNSKKGKQKTIALDDQNVVVSSNSDNEELNDYALDNTVPKK
jgi:hypothetical protein